MRAALAAIEAGRFAEAVGVCEALLAENPADIDATCLLGLARGARGEVDAAAVLLDRVARARRGHAHPCRDLAELLERRGEGARASAQYRAALALAPEDGRLRRAFARHLLARGDAAGAVESVDAGGDAASQEILGLARAELGEFGVAADHFRRLVALDPRPASGWSNLGMMLKVEGRFEEAVAAHDEAVARAPQDPQIRVNRAVALLHAGRFAEAWQDYEWRLRLPGHQGLPLETLLPSLEDVEGRTVLLVHEEGFGDTLQFVRYAPLLAARGARVLLAVPRELERLLVHLGQVVAMDRALPSFDYHCPFFSLPRAFATTLETIPAQMPYLRADPVLAAAWAQHLPPVRGLRVGLVWAGQARPWLPGFATLDARRSLALSEFAPLGDIPGIDFISLQKGEKAHEAASPPAGLALFDPMPGVEDFADTAAIIANLDLVVSVDTSVVHLAGALGKPVFLLDRYDNCWRWLSVRADSPWYPGLTIFRQDRPGDWSGPMRRVAAALHQASIHSSAMHRP